MNFSVGVFYAGEREGVRGGKGGRSGQGVGEGKALPKRDDLKGSISELPDVFIYTVAE